MWMESYVEDIVLRSRIAEAQREAARHRLLRGVERGKARHRRPWAVVQRFVEAVSILRLKRRTERMALR